jgi:hypothetical protein
MGSGTGWQDPSMLGPPPSSVKCPLPTLSHQGRLECAELREMPSSSGRHQAIGCGQDIASTILEMRGGGWPLLSLRPYLTTPLYHVLRETLCIYSVVHLFIQEAFTVVETYDHSI